MSFGLGRMVMAAAILAGGTGFVAGKAASGDSPKTPVTLDNTRWNVRAKVVKVPAYQKTTNFRDVLEFRFGTVTGDALQKQGLNVVPYHFEKVKGSRTEVKWSFEHFNTAADRFEWQGIVHMRGRGPWKMQGSLTKTTPDGQIYKYRLRGTVRAVPPLKPPEVTPSGK